MKKPGFEYLDHTADIRIHTWGQNVNIAFSQAVYALMEVISPDIRKIEAKIQRTFEIISEDLFSLLFDFLTEFLYFFDAQGLVFSKVNINDIKKINDKYYLKAEALGEIFSPNKHDIGTEVKAITYSDMEIKIKEDSCEIYIVLDI